MDVPIEHSSRKTPSIAALWERPRKDSTGTQSTSAEPIPRSQPRPKGSGGFVNVQKLIQQYSGSASDRDSAPLHSSRPSDGNQAPSVHHKPSPTESAPDSCLIYDQHGILDSRRGKGSSFLTQATQAAPAHVGIKSSEPPYSLAPHPSHQLPTPDFPSSGASSTSALSSTNSDKAQSPSEAHIQSDSESSTSFRVLQHSQKSKGSRPSAAASGISHLRDQSSEDLSQPDPRLRYGSLPRASKTPVRSLSYESTSADASTDPSSSLGVHHAVDRLRQLAAGWDDGKSGDLDADPDTGSRDSDKAKRRRRLLREQLKRRSKRRSANGRVANASESAASLYDYLPDSDNDLESVASDSLETPEPVASPGPSSYSRPNRSRAHSSAHASSQRTQKDLNRQIWIDSSSSSSAPEEEELDEEPGSPQSTYEDALNEPRSFTSTPSRIPVEASFLPSAFSSPRRPRHSSRSRSEQNQPSDDSDGPWPDHLAPRLHEPRSTSTLRQEALNPVARNVSGSSTASDLLDSSLPDHTVRSSSTATSASSLAPDSPLSSAPSSQILAPTITSPNSSQLFVPPESAPGVRTHRSNALPPPRPTPSLPPPPPPSVVSSAASSAGSSDAATGRPRGQSSTLSGSSLSNLLSPDEIGAGRNRSQSLGQAASVMSRAHSYNDASSSRVYPPIAEARHEDESGMGRSSGLPASRDPTSSSAPVVGASSLGPSGTIRGRPRGFTVGAVPASSGLGSYTTAPHRASLSGKARPRSLLCHEITPGLDLAEPRRPSSSAVSEAVASSASSPAELSRPTPRSSSLSDSVKGLVLTQDERSAGGAPAPSGEGSSGNRDDTANGGGGGSGSSGNNGGSGGGDQPERRSGGRSRSGSSASLLQQVKSQPKSHASFVIAVVGHQQAGKSTVIKKGLRQFGLSKPHVLSEKVTSHSTVCVVDQEQRTIEVLEIDATVLLNGPGKRFAWPKFLPRIDAVILCYDAAQISSFRGMSELLEQFAANNLSTVMLACKSEVHPKAVDPYYASDMASVYNVGLAECTVQSEEGKKRMRDCFSYLVKEVAKARNGRSRKTVPSTLPSQTQQMRYQQRLRQQQEQQLHDHQQHMRPRASQDGSTSGSVVSGTESVIDPDQFDVASSRGSFSSTRARGNSAASSTGDLPVGSTGGQGSLESSMGRVSLDMSPSSPAFGQGYSPNYFPGRSSSDLKPTARKMSNATVASVMSDSPSFTGSQSEDDLMLQESLAKARLGLQNARSAGGYVTIEELWDKLFHAAVSGSDDRFLAMFMVFYRGFARPIDLLRQMVIRFELLTQNEDADGIINRFALIRLTTMLADWVQDYPGDLSAPETHTMLRSFYIQLLQHPATTHTANQVRFAVEAAAAAPDMDEVWSKSVNSVRPQSVAADVAPIKMSGSEQALPDMDLSKPLNEASSMTSASSSSLPSTQNMLASHSSDNLEHEASSSPGPDGSDSSQLPTFDSAFGGRDRSASDVTASSNEGGSRAASARAGVTGSAWSQPSGGAVVTMPQALSSSGQLVESPGMRPSDQRAVLRNMSNALAEIDDEVIASELTRLEWVFFTAIRPRDLLRHILVPRELRTGPVSRSIAHFNYISSWVCSMILAQGKTKARARMLEKFYNIASILRHDNNYGSLNSVLGGLSKTAVHRLKHTRELLKGKPVNKTYQSLVRLMSSERSNAAYRLALENSEGPTIPYVGVHLQDILSISDGNPSKRADGLIHWRKFSLMDEAVMAVVRCQQYDRTIKPNPAVERLILDAPVLDDEALYERSLLVEPRSQTGPAMATSKIKDLKSFLASSS